MELRKMTKIEFLTLPNWLFNKPIFNVY